MSEAKKSYRQLVWTDAPVFHQPWWLDAVAGDSWDVCLLKDGGEVNAYFLYAIKNDFTGFQIMIGQNILRNNNAFRVSDFANDSFHLEISSCCNVRNNIEIKMLQH